jgi:transposase InsO family protein
VKPLRALDHGASVPGQRIVAEWLERYDAERPHSALGYQTPKEYREKLAA